ncbi:MAG: hypothetical protein M4D80_17890 [Myxococcota bacterium]|nr:hypothetical protein [Myxococcota bacterium]
MRPLLFSMLAGCTFSTPIDVGGDASALPLDACVTFSGQLDTCALRPGPAVELSGTLELSTLTGMLTNKLTGQPVAVFAEQHATKGDPVFAIIAANVTIAPNTSLRAIGPKGFAIISTNAITLGANAVIDVSDNGAGARTALCDSGPTKGQDDAGGAAGGGGAGFGGAGGRGGDGNSDAFLGNTSDGGNPGAVLGAPLGPRGGCPGAPGGNGNETGGTGGRGGGSVWLAAGNRIELAVGAGINAGGSGGGGGIRTNSQGDAGGGGGGSGGVIWIESPRVRSMGTLAANGGGGGEGSGGDASGAMGAVGVLGTSRALGGTGASNSGAAGGAGGHKLDAAGLQAANPDPGGGGGGGGGVGFIRVISPDSSLSTVSP